MSNKILKMDNIPEKLLNAGEIKYLEKNEILIHAGDVLDCIYILVKGKILVISNSKTGNMIYDFLYISPCIIGEVSVIKKIEIAVSFKCLDAVKVIKINKNVLINILKTDFDLIMYLYETTYNKFINIESQARENATLSSIDRIVKMLVEFSELLGTDIDGKIKINYKLRHQFISDFLGVTRLTTMNALKKLEQNNLITISNGYYYVNNLDSLKNFINIK